MLDERSNGGIFSISRWLIAAAITILLTFGLVFLRANASTSAILYLVVVVWFATFAGPVLSISLAVVSALLLDYYFLDPLYSINIAGSKDWLAMTSFLVSCVIVSRVAERARRQTQQAEQRRDDVERLNTLSQEMMLHEDAIGLVRDIPRLVERNFALESVLLYVRGDDQLYSTIPGGSYPATVAPLAPHPENRAGFDPESFNRMRLSLRLLSATLEQDAELPGDYASINLLLGMNSVGTLAWKPARLSREIATSIAAQVAIAITRGHAIEASAHMEAARSADRLRSALIDSLTHELRTPLTAIRAAASTLIDGRGLDAELRTELATVVEEESQRLDTLIGEAIEMAEIDADSIRIKPVPLHTRTVLEQAFEESRAQLTSHHVTIDVEEPDSPAWFDPHLIGRVLRHLLENAARYTPAGSHITLRSRRVPGRIEFQVEDDGPGIDSFDLPLVFEKFYRGRRQAASIKGSGMGLAIVRAILAAHHGSIEIESVPGQGTLFRFWIPARDKPPESEQAD